MDTEAVASADGWPGLIMYGWWTSLEISNEQPFLFIDAGKVSI